MVYQFLIMASDWHFVGMLATGLVAVMGVTVCQIISDRRWVRQYRRAHQS